jgi:hypothetical protein
MTESVESNRLTLVKPRSTWIITSKTEPTTPNDPLGHVKTTCGQTWVEDTTKPRLNPDVSACFGTFVVFSKFYLNTSKSPNMKVV